MPDWWRLYAEPESVADVEVEVRMVQRGWGRHLKSQFGVQFDPETDGVRGTTVDLYWGHPYNHAVFLDGPHHEKIHQERIDDLVTEALEKRGFTVQRIPYDPPRTKQERRLVYGGICDEIETALKRKLSVSTGANARKEPLQPELLKEAGR